MKNLLAFIWEVLKIVVIALLIVLPIRYFLFQPFFVNGQSMEPNFEDGDYLIVDELSYRMRAPERGEVVVFNYPHDPTQRYIKRIIGLPGETLEIVNGKIYVLSNGNEEYNELDESSYLSTAYTSGSLTVELGESEYFVLGDNRAASSDSRKWGNLPKENIIGRVYLRAWPIASFDKIGTPVYQ
ncbi:MAG: signal peptidase I [Candidatus Paceibacterota bacterium]